MAMKEEDMGRSSSSLSQNVNCNNDHDDDDIMDDHGVDDFSFSFSSNRPRVKDVLRVFACLHPHRISRIELIQPIFNFPIKPEIEIAIESKMLVASAEEKEQTRSFQNNEYSENTNSSTAEDKKYPSETSSSSCMMYYSFPNESVWKLVYFRLLPEREREKCHLELARRLWKTLHLNEDTESSSSRFNDDQQAELMDMTLSQFMKGQKCITRDKEITAIRSLCLQAGQVAAKKSSDFVKAAAYLNFGIRLLNDHNNWKKQQHEEYALTLALYNAAAEMECCIGNFAQMDLLIDKVLEHAVCFVDKQQAYATRILGLAASKRVTEALETGVSVLRTLGETRFPPKRFQMLHIMHEFWRLERDFARRSNGQLLRLPPMEDERILHIMQILNVLIFPTNMYNLRLGPLLSLRMMRLTLDYGLSALAPVSFSHFGMVCSTFDLFELGNRCAGLALELLGRYQTQEYLPRVYVGVYGVIHRYRNPPRENIGPLREAYRVGMVTGDLEFAGIAMTMACTHSLEAGDSLDKLLVEYCIFRDTMHSKRQELQIQLTLPFIQGIHHLMGISEDPLVVLPATREDIQPDGGTATTGSMGRIMTMWQIRLFYVFNDYESAAAVVDKQIFRDAFIIDPAFGFYCTLVSVAMLRHRQRQGKQIHCWIRKKHQRNALYGLKRLRQLAKASPYDCSGKLCLVQAELASVRGDNGQAMLNYVMAISLTKQVENTFEYALANERTARHILGATPGDVDDPRAAARRYFQTALEAYGAWGGKAKVERLQSEMETLYMADTAASTMELTPSHPNT
jgi:hypothetical protein